MTQPANLITDGRQAARADAEDAQGLEDSRSEQQGRDDRAPEPGPARQGAVACLSTAWTFTSPPSPASRVLGSGSTQATSRISKARSSIPTGSGGGAAPPRERGRRT